MIEHNFQNSNENVIEFLTNQQTITCTFSARKWINKIKKLHESHPDEVHYVENTDGSICAHIPYKYLKISPPRKVQLSDEQKVERAKRLMMAREQRASSQTSHSS